MAPEEGEELLRAIDGLSEEELRRLGFEPLAAGFANRVCGAERRGLQLVVKRYTDLVFLRIAAEAVGAVDVYAGEVGVGPRVLHASERGLVMERLPGETLEEKDIHKGDYELLGKVAKLLARMHRLPVPPACTGEPMLWRTVDKMMDVVAQKPELLPAGLPGVPALRGEVAAARAALERHQPRIVLGHNDFKPSNVITDGGDVRFIDFELGGPSYRGFDLMKVLRTNDAASEACIEHFLGAYASEVGERAAAVAALREEVRLFEPLTWLEAAVFFLALMHFKTDETTRWRSLAVHRWQKYEETKHQLFGRAEVGLSTEAGCPQLLAACAPAGGAPSHRGDSGSALPLRGTAEAEG